MIVVRGQRRRRRSVCVCRRIHEYVTDSGRARCFFVRLQRKLCSKRSAKLVSNFSCGGNNFHCRARSSVSVDVDVCVSFKDIGPHTSFRSIPIIGSRTNQNQLALTNRQTHKQTSVCVRTRTHTYTQTRASGEKRGTDTARRPPEQPLARRRRRRRPSTPTFAFTLRTRCARSGLLARRSRVCLRRLLASRRLRAHLHEPPPPALKVMMS